MNLSELTRAEIGDAVEVLRGMASESVQCCVTSPPYFGLRSYLPKDHPDKSKELGTEETPQQYVDRMVAVFREVRRVLRKDGTLWLNVGDSYAAHGSGAAGKELKWMGEAISARQARKPAPGLKAKDLIGIPWMLAFALRDDGWWLRQDIIWHKPSPMPSSVRDRCTTAHEYLFLLTKAKSYYYDSQAIAEKAVSGYNGSVFTKGKTRQAAEQMRPVSDLPREESSTRNRRSVFSIESTSNRERECVEVIESNLTATEKWATIRALIDCESPPDVWKIASKSYKGAHYAVMPPKLAEPCVKAGTSERGCCGQCGTPVTRVGEKTRAATRPGADTKVTGDGAVDGNRDPQRHVTETKTVGWAMGCKCGDVLVPCVVLDPFGGSGVVAAVCEELGRRSVMIDLDERNLTLMQERIAKARTGRTLLT